MEKDRLIYELLQKVELLTLRLKWAEDKIAALELGNVELKIACEQQQQAHSSDGCRKKPAFINLGKENKVGNRAQKRHFEPGSVSPNLR